MFFRPRGKMNADWSIVLAGQEPQSWVGKATFNEDNAVRMAVDDYLNRFEGDHCPPDSEHDILIELDARPFCRIRVGQEKTSVFAWDQETQSWDKHEGLSKQFTDFFQYHRANVGIVYLGNGLSRIG
ncbi:MAG: hypothetical protein ABH846_03750 [Patescibacteria group bacterium]